jgi:UDP-glucuronate decarboxylase
MKLLLTGGTGFFGRALLRSWIRDELCGVTVPEVTILTRSPISFVERYPEFSSKSWLTLHESNILNYKSLPVDDFFTHILHAATESTIGPSLSALQRYNEIVDGTRNILDYAVKNNVKRILLTSSGGVYGPQPATMSKIPESYLGIPDPLDPMSAYSIGKRAAEHLCSLYNQHFGLESVIARCFSFAGKDLPLNAHFAIGNFIYDALHSDEITITGNGAPIRSYMDQADLANWLMCILDKGIAGHAYNVGSDKGIKISELAHLVRDILSPNKSVVFMDTATTFQGRNIYIPDIRVAKSELNLDVRISLNESIAQFAKWPL